MRTCIEIHNLKQQLGIQHKYEIYTEQTNILHSLHEMAHMISRKCKVLGSYMNKVSESREIGKGAVGYWFKINNKQN